MSSEKIRTFDQRYADYTPTRDEDLGKLYEPPSPNRPLALKVYNWVADLSSEQQKQLKKALDDLQRLRHPLLLRVINYRIESVETDPNAPNQNYIEYGAMTFVSLDQWPQWPLTDRLREAAALIIELATRLIDLHKQATVQQIFWIRPLLKPEKIWLKGVVSGTMANLPTELVPILTEPGLVSLLTDPTKEQRFSLQEEVREIRALGQLFLQLSRDPSRFRETPVTPQETEGAVKEVTALYPQVVETLQEFFRRSLNSNQADSYRSIAEVGEALRTLALRTPTPMPMAPPVQTLPTPVRTTERTERRQSGAPPVEPGEQPQPALASTHDLLLVDYINPQPGERRIEYALKKDAIVTLGNSAEDTVFLPRLSSPRRLMVLYQNSQYTERYVVTDSGNSDDSQDDPALLDGLPLSPYFAAIFHENSRLEIAGYRMTVALKRLTANPFALRNNRPLQVAQTRYAAAPGAAVQIQAIIHNVTNEVDSFWIAVDGAADKVQVELPEAQRLFENGSVEVKLTVYLPPLLQSSAGDLPLILRLISENYRVQIGALRIFIKILPHYDFVSALSPETLRLGRDGELTIENHGNLTRTFAIQWRDRAQELDFVPDDTTVTAPAQSVVKVTYRAYIRRRQWRLLGGPHFHPMNVLVNPRGGGTPQTLTGQVVSRALIPGWAPLAALLLVLLFLFAASFLFQPEFATVATAKPMDPLSRNVTPTWIAVPTPMAGERLWLLWQPVGSCFYSIYENGNIVSGPNFTFGRNSPQEYEVRNKNEGTIVEVRLRSCLLLGERSWQVVVQPPPATTPTPTATMVPSIAATNVKVVHRDQPALMPMPDQFGKDGVLRLLIGQTGEFCFSWQTAGVEGSLTITPTLAMALTGASGEQCQPINELFREVTAPTDYSLVGKQGDYKVVSAPFARIEVRSPTCRVNIAAVPGLTLALREGPGRTFAERGWLASDNLVLVLARPFKPMEQEDELEWLLVAIPDDPRPAWVAYREQAIDPAGKRVTNEYLACPPDIGAMPAAEAIPPTPTPTPTGTPEPTVTPTATPASLVSLEPPIVNPGGCATLKWQIENVKEVYLNEEGVIGQGEKTVCPPAAGAYTYEWKIIKSDDTVMKVTKTLTVNPGTPGTPAVPTPPE